MLWIMKLDILILFYSWSQRLAALLIIVLELTLSHPEALPWPLDKVN